MDGGVTKLEFKHALSPEALKCLVILLKEELVSPPIADKGVEELK
jgi:hypothetical protein